jgi:hypothetical protein
MAAAVEVVLAGIREAEVAALVVVVLVAEVVVVVTATVAAGVAIDSSSINSAPRARQ